MKIKLFFHYISYLQYPLILIGLFYAFKPHFDSTKYTKENVDLAFQNINTVFIFIGLALSFSTLQDTTKTQNKLSRKIWEHPVKGKIALVIMSIITFTLIVSGIVGYTKTGVSKLKDVSMGVIVLGVGYLGLLKAAIEMFENHRRDKNNIDSL